LELGWPIAIPMLWIINAAEAQLPLVIPIANIIWDKVVVGIKGFSDPKEGRHGGFESARSASH
jgi:hypothetical protein